MMVKNLLQLQLLYSLALTCYLQSRLILSFILLMLRKHALYLTSLFLKSYLKYMDACIHSLHMNDRITCL